MVARSADRSSHRAALLLLQVRMIAIGEVRDHDHPLPTCGLLAWSEEDSKASYDVLKPSASTTEQKVHAARKLRCRTVSLCSQDELKLDSPSPTMTSITSVLVEPDSPVAFLGSPKSSSRSERICWEQTRKASVATPLPFSPSSKFVGETVEAPLKATLRKKFSWKSYPELEAYLVENREQYMQYSSQLNYTAEQKRYNNTLTQGLLELASQEGYRFEGFTFAAIRDRIRCYYKSFVQASKKRKRRKSK